MRIAGNPKRTQTDKEEVETWNKGKNKKIFQMSFQHGIKMALLLKQSQSYTDLYNIFLFSKARVLSPIWIFIERTQDRSIQCDQKESLWTSCNFAWAGSKYYSVHYLFWITCQSLVLAYSLRLSKWSSFSKWTTKKYSNTTENKIN